MNLDYLNTYRELIRLGSFTEVAKKLSVSQPAISFQISKLERDLGVRLIDRGQKTITMTEAGKRLLRFAELVSRERVKLASDIDQLREEVSGKIIIAASTIPGEILLPPVMGEFKALHPAIQAKLEISDSTSVISGVMDGTYDIGFCGTAPEGRELDYFKVAEDEIVLIVFPEHPFADRTEISFMELKDEPLIWREETSGTQQSLISLLSKSGYDVGKWSPSLVLGTTQAVVSAVEARVGITFVSNMAIKKSVALGLVKQISVEELTLIRDFYCIYRQKRVVSRILSEFLSFTQARGLQP